MNLHGPPKVAAGVAKAAMETGVARLQMDPDQIYHRTLEYLLEGGFLRNGDE
jgi:malic enzyme